ncbi:LacI family transcriptional regulator [Bacteroidia bacterium]|nr:LacI family transcriptional regulator [Bacteroidia bacterium]
MSSSLKDIAKALNVSKTTVSWVLANQGDERKISAVTQEKIRAYAKEMGYQPNLLAKSLSEGTSHTLGLIVPSIGDEFYAQIAKEIELEAKDYGYTLTFCSSETDVGRESEMIRMLKSKRVDGLIIAPTKLSKLELEIMIEEKFPFVLIDRFFPELDTNYVIIDNEGACENLVNWLIHKGKKKIAFVTTDTHLLVMNKRHDGYKKALTESRLPILLELYGEVKRNEYETDIINVLDKIFRQVPDVDGFCFSTHYLALEALRYFYKHNMDIKDKIGLATLHTTPSFGILAPQMNIAHQPVREIGRNAVHILVNELEKSNPSHEKVKMVLPTMLDFKP